ncbi:MuDR family transposase, partial [Striga hermonthica]
PFFKRMYICWEALKSGLREGCRPVICLDGCHLKTSCGRILLTAVGIDGNNCIYPFAYAVVEQENKNSWNWFVELLKTL